MSSSDGAGNRGSLSSSIAEKITGEAGKKTGNDLASLIGRLLVCW